MDALILRKEILNWRDKHTEAVDAHLKRELVFLFNAIDKEIDEVPFREVLRVRQSWAKEHIEPLFRQWVEREAGHLISDAQKDLRAICDHIYEYKKAIPALDHGKGLGQSPEATMAAAGIGGGLLAIPVFASMATVSAGGLLGVIGLTTISWPIAVAGFAVVGGLLAFGGQKAAGLKDSAKNRYRRKIQESITRQVLGADDFSDSIRQRLHNYIVKTASAARREVPS